MNLINANDYNIHDRPKNKREIEIIEARTEFTIKKQMYPPIRDFQVVVEGETDKKFYKEVFNVDICKIIPMNGVKNVKYVFLKKGPTEDTFSKDILDNKAIGLIDRDFQDLSQKSNIYHPEKYHNLFVTETNDLETLVLKNGGISLFLNEMCDEHLKEQFKVKCKISDFKSFLINCSNYIGLVRCMKNRDNRFRFSLRNFNLNGVMCRCFSCKQLNTPQIIIDCIIDWIFSDSSGNLYDIEFVSKYKKMLNKIDNQFSDRWDLCQGHDTVNILLYLQFILGKELELKTEDELFERISKLFLDSDRKFFTKTSLCQTLIGWESKYFPFKDKKMLKSNFY